MKSSSTAMVRRKISPLPLSQTSVTGLPAERLAAFDLPGRVGAGHVVEAEIAAGAQP
jgi:hypothetical protein